MGEVTRNMNGILPKIVSLFNNKLFSDFQFVFHHDGSSSVLYGHKLILAVRSDYFASMFYENDESTDKLELPADRKSSCYFLLKFLYTDDACLETLTIKEVEDIQKLANYFGIKDLELKCFDYVLKEKITIENIFPRYEQALNSKFESLLINCRKFVSYEAMSVFQSTEFSDASVLVIEDILKLNNLSVSTELIIVNSILKWCMATCKKNNYPLEDKYLREQIYPFFKYLRFLTLNWDEFQNVSKHNIFTSYESTILTCKILQPQSEITIPEYICSETTKRENLHSSITSGKISKFNKSISVTEGENLIVNTTPKLFSKSEKLIPQVNSAENDSYIDDRINVPINRRKLIEKPQNIPTDYSKFNTSPPTLQNQRNPPYRANYSKSNRFSYKIETPSSNVENEVSKYRSSPNLIDFYNIPISTPQKTFHFPLSPISKNLDCSFSRDLNCSAVFKMKNGRIKLYGFDIFVKSDNSKKLNIDVELTGFSEDFNKRYDGITFKDNLYNVKFPTPMLLKEGKKGAMEVSIDNLYLDRCLVYSSDTCEFNNGSGCVCEMVMKSNRKASNGFAFLIFNIHYSPF